MKNTARAAAFAGIISWAAAIPNAFPMAQSLGDNCQTTELGNCVLPLQNDATACGTTDLDCVCGVLYSMVNCYDEYCPNAELPSEVDRAISLCGDNSNADPNTSVGSGGSDDGNTDDGSDDGATGVGGIISPNETSDVVSAPTRTPEANDDDDDDDDNSDDGNDDEETSAAERPPARTTAETAPVPTGAAGHLVVPASGALAALMAVMAWL